MFSIIIANFNKQDYIAEAINSVLKQTNQDWELIIFDDASTDNSEEEIKKFLTNQKIRYYANKKNSGKIAVLRQSIDLARGEIIVELDSDDTLALNTLDEIGKAYKTNPECGMVYSQCWYCDENLKPIHLGFSAAIPGGKSNLHVNSVVALRTFKKEAYLKTSGYDESILYAEDLDLILKLEETTKLYFLNKPLYFYRILPKSQTHSFKNEMINRSSSALAKSNAYRRRQGTAISNLNPDEIVEVLCWGVLTSILSLRIRLAAKFINGIFRINPFFFLRPNLYVLLIRKINKITKQKLNYASDK